MKPCLGDVNAFLPLFARDHEHHKPAQRWFDRLAENEAGICRHVELGVIRLLSNRKIMGQLAMAPADAWRMTEALRRDERVVFVQEPEGIDSIFPGLLNMPAPSGKPVGDAYLAAFAIASSRRMATFDAGFRQFKGLEVEILAR